MSQAPHLRVVPADVARATAPPAAWPLRPADPCCFGPFELQVRERLLLAHGRPTDVRGKALDLLVVLAAHAGQLLTRQQLMDAVWGRLVVEDNNLSVQINALRKVLGEGLITTVPGHGYRFNASLAPPASHARLLAQPLPPADTAPRTSHLPAQLPPLIGRAEDMAAVMALFDQHPLVTVTGAGGIGKTRLAQAVLHSRREAFAHGVCFVELTELEDPARLPQHLAAALGLRLPAAADGLAALARAVAPLSVGLVLDNAEHLAAAVAGTVQALLQEAPGLRLLVTSQVRLRLAQEHVYRLGALAVPPPQAGLSVAQSQGAVALFVARAQAQDHRFVLDDGNVGTVAELCRRLDGSALAIELAAARLPLLGLPGLLASLEQRLKVLTRGPRDAPRRQSTLRSALAWSHQLLAPPEQRIWRRLAVFVGSFSLRQAQDVLAAHPEQRADERLDEWAVLDGLSGLVEKSLLSAVDADDPPAPVSSPRFALLESPRALALEMMQAAGEGPELQRRHAQAMAAHFEQACARVFDGQAPFDATQHALEQDLPNAQTALRWALAHDATLALAFAPLLSLFLGRQRYEERAALWRAVGPGLAQAPAQAGGEADRFLARACLQHAEHVGITRPQQSLALAQRASTLALQAGDHPVAYLAIGKMAHAAWRRGDRAGLNAAWQSMLQLQQPEHSPYLLLMRASVQAWVCLMDGDPAGALLHFEQQAALSRAAGVDDSLAMINVMRLHIDAQHADHAVTLARQLVDRHEGGRNQHLLGTALNALLLAQLADAQWPAARLTLQRFWPLARRFEMHPPWADAAAQLLLAEGHPPAALQLAGFADAALAALGQVREAADQARRDRAVQRARDALGGSCAADDGPPLLAKGARLTLDSLPALARLLPA